MPIRCPPRERTERRADYVFQEAQRVIRGQAFREIGATVVESYAQMCAECYFIISDEYKERKLNGTSPRTEYAKVAAILTCAVITIEPIRVFDLGNSEQLYVNSILAMRLACAAIKYDFERRSFEDKLFQYNALRAVSCPAANEYVRRISEGEHNLFSEYDIELGPDDFRVIEKLTVDFRVYQELGEKVRRSD